MKTMVERLMEAAQLSDAQWGDTRGSILREAAEALAGSGEVAFYVQPHLVEMCRQISGVQKEHRVVVATEQTGSHTVPLYLTPSRAGGGEVGDGWISVKDRLPDFTNWNKTSSGEVAIQNDRGEVMSAEWAFNSYASSARGKVPRWERGGRIYQGIVTHWQQLPAALHGAGARGD